MQQICFVPRAASGAAAVVDLTGVAGQGGDASIDLAPVYREHGERWKQAFVDWLGALNIGQASRNWWAFTSGAKNMLSSPLGDAIFQVLAIDSAVRQVPGSKVQVAGATPGQVRTLVRHFRRRGARVRVARSVLRSSLAWSGLPRLVWHALRVVGVHVLRRRTASPSAQTCLMTYVDRGFKDGFDAFFGPLAGMLAEKSGEMPLHVALIQAPWREMLPRLGAANRYRYWPLFHELRLADVGRAFVDTLRAMGDVGRLSRSAGPIEGIDVAPLLAEALLWDLGPGGYFFNQLVFRAARRFAQRVGPQRMVYPFEMKSLEKMFILGVRSGAPSCRLVGYQHTSITLRHTTFLLAPGEHTVTPLPDFVVTVGEVTRDYLAARGGYPKGFFRTGGALRQIQRSVLPAGALDGRPLRLLLALSSSRRELVDAVAMLCALRDLHGDIEIGVRPHPEFPLSLLPSDLRQVAEGSMCNLSGTLLTENLEWCDAVIYVSSTVALEALMAGRPVITLRLSDAIDPDPLLGEPSLRLRAASVSELAKCCDELRTLLSTENQSARLAAADYVRSYLCPMTPAGLGAFLEPAAPDAPDGIIRAERGGCVS